MSIFGEALWGENVPEKMPPRRGPVAQAGGKRKGKVPRMAPPMRSCFRPDQAWAPLASQRVLDMLGLKLLVYGQDTVHV